MVLAVTEIAGHGKAVVHHGYGFCRTQCAARALELRLAVAGGSLTQLTENGDDTTDFIKGCLFRSVFKKFFHDFVEAALSCIVQGRVLEVV